LSAAAGHHADVDIAGNFGDARAYLDAAHYDLLVTNLRLGEFNGIHLAYMVNLASVPTHVLVYADSRDAASARDIQRAGALYEDAERLPVVLSAYIGATLPPVDRRDPLQFDRRRLARGGRRAWDRSRTT
jgi:hypothetical protein